MAYSALTYFLANAYPTFFHAKWGRTVGKMMVRIRVVQTDGTAIGWREALLRSSVDLAIAAIVLTSELVFLSGVDPTVWPRLSLEGQAAIREKSALAAFDNVMMNVEIAWTFSEVLVMLTNKRRRALHDFIAGTVVIRHREAVAAIPSTPPALA